MRRALPWLIILLVVPASLIFVAGLRQELVQSSHMTNSTVRMGVVVGVLYEPGVDSIAKAARNADLIVIGRIATLKIVKGQPVFDAYRIVGYNYTIYTIATLQVVSVLKGQPLNEIDVATLGGELEGLKVELTTAPKFRVGETVLLFLYKANIQGHGPVYFVLADTFGKWRIEQDIAVREFIDRVSDRVPLYQLISDIRKALQG